MYERSPNSFSENPFLWIASIIGVAFLLVIVFLAATIKPLPQTDTIVHKDGATIVTVNSGTKIVKFDDGRIACFDKWGRVCDDFDSKIVVNVPDKIVQVR